MTIARRALPLRHSLLVAAVAVLCALAVTFIRPPAARGAEHRAPRASHSLLASSLASNANDSTRMAFLDTLRGASKKLRARFLSPRRAAGIPVLRELFGEPVAQRPGVYTTGDSTGGFHFITMRPFADKVQGRIGTYRIGNFPSERRTAARAITPEGFLEVTLANQDTRISEHFRLRDFLTKDQHHVWPKYLVLREPLLDKLELVLSELRTMGITANQLKVMSGFRTPQYNAQGVGAGGRVTDSRHQYGDAADVYVVNGSKDWMADLNGDGRVDTRDARVLAQAAERVEQRYPELIGGVGIYKATSAHGPFVHIDVRGTRARWGEL
ncbi:MAG: hypothetical protein IBJ03_16555 [Gemmatimonadaceae bacterium]|nr:hypothetical protein [Gemmatimonadaceae bacterium]